jgi:hypothetical protein
MAIKVFNNTVQNKRTEVKYSSFEELKKKAAATPQPKPAFTAPVRKAPDITNEKPPTINNGIIKPKYIQNKDVVYKKSGYVKDLLGEEN